MRKAAALVVPPAALRQLEFASSHGESSSLSSEEAVRQESIHHETFCVNDDALTKNRKRKSALFHNLKQKLTVTRKSENSNDLDNSHKRMANYFEDFSSDSDDEDDAPTNETSPDDDSLTQDDNDDSQVSHEEPCHSSRRRHGTFIRRFSAPAIAVVTMNPLDSCIRYPPRSMSTSAIPQLRSCLKHDSREHKLDDVSSSRTVSFGQIHMREYNRAVVDNPAVSEGPPIGLSWEFNPQEIQMKVDEYENARPPRRVKDEMIMPSHVRQEMLINEWGHTMREIRQASVESRQMRQLREKALHTNKVSEKLTEALESSKRKFYRLKTGMTKEMEREQLWIEASEWLDTKGSDDSSI
jgi:hypothetical protein